jgi:hypothetical protein
MAVPNSPPLLVTRLMGEIPTLYPYSPFPCAFFRQLYVRPHIPVGGKRLFSMLSSYRCELYIVVTDIEPYAGVHGSLAAHRVLYSIRYAPDKSLGGWPEPTVCSE